MREPTRNIAHFEPQVLIYLRAIALDREHRVLWLRGRKVVI
jgi:hypothetical protein